MDYAWMDAYCLQKPGVSKDYKAEWNATRYFVGGKMFAMQGGDKVGKPIFTLKLEPSFGELLRRQYADIVPGYYMNKAHWNSLYLDGAVPNEVVCDMLDRSYATVLAALPKKVREPLAGQ